MSNKTDGGPAFPTPDITHDDGETQTGCWGMSLRDWFAGQMIAVVNDNATGESLDSAAESLEIPVDEYNGEKHWPMLLAKRAYAIADAMIAERT